MRIALSPRIQQLLALAIAGTLFLAIAVFIVAPMWSASVAHADQVDLFRRRVLRMQGIAEAAPQFEKLLKQTGNNPDIQQITIAAPQPSLAVAQLQSKLSQIFAASSATVSQSQSMPDSKEGALTKVTVQANIEADIKSLTAALHAIDEARPLLTIEKLTIRDPDGEFAALPNSGVPANVANKLQAEMLISAYVRTP